ncbi:MAG: purine nucleoside phosphorylase [Myxococcales bacterium]|nr:purine nucleoside phosphorylase [Myxococcales bacterium]
MSSAELSAAVAAVRAALPPSARPTVGLILGSGLGAFADTLEARVAVPFEKIPGLPPSTIVGHAGNVVYGTKGGVEVLALQGRVHFYEGHDLQRVAFPARVLVAAGCKTLVITNAAGGVATSLSAGEIVIVSDHLNLLGGSPLRGPNDQELGPRFPDMTEAYDRKLRALAAAAGKDVGLTLREGIYAACQGPQYETPAEVRMLRGLGADLVGMSTVPEVIAAVHMGARVLGLSCCTNLAAGVTGEKLSHSEVTETAARVRDRFIALLGRVLERIAAGEA